MCSFNLIEFNITIVFISINNRSLLSHVYQIYLPFLTLDNRLPNSLNLFNAFLAIKYDWKVTNEMQAGYHNLIKTFVHVPDPWMFTLNTNDVIYLILCAKFERLHMWSISAHHITIATRLSGTQHHWPHFIYYADWFS